MTTIKVRKENFTGGNNIALNRSGPADRLIFVLGCGPALFLRHQYPILLPDSLYPSKPDHQPGEITGVTRVSVVQNAFNRIQFHFCCCLQLFHQVLYKSNRNVSNDCLSGIVTRREP